MIRPSTSPHPRPFRTVLVATDFSPDARHAVERALTLPLGPDAFLGLLYVDEGPSGGPPSPRSAGNDLEATARDAHARLRSAGHEGLRVVPILARGDAATEIALHARLAAAGLVVVGRRGATDPDAPRGRTARRLLDIVPAPLLVVSNIAGEPYRRPLAAVDLEMASVDVLLLCARVAAGGAQEGTAVHAVTMGFEGTRGFRGARLNAWGELRRRDAVHRLRELLGEIPACGIAWTADVRHGSAGAVISRVARDRAADLLAVGTHALEGLPRWLLGSVAADVLRDAPCDILVARPDHRVRAFPPRSGSVWLAEGTREAPRTPASRPARR